jgi:hypothetical protein
MRWLIDSDILIEGERGNPLFEAWSRSEGEFATADVIRADLPLRQSFEASLHIASSSRVLTDTRPSRALEPGIGPVH